MVEILLSVSMTVRWQAVSPMYFLDPNIICKIVQSIDIIFKIEVDGE